MSGRCYSCASSFGAFNKELGCKNCGFAFCKKCLTKKTAVPQHNNMKLAVCGKCYDILTGKTVPMKVESFQAPDTYYKRLAALEAAQNQPQPSKSLQPAVVPRTSAKCKGLSKEDAAMAERLERLKKDTKPANVPSQSEIEARLERLKQEESAASNNTTDDLVGRLARVRGQDQVRANQPHVFAVDRRTQQEQIDALLEEIGDELEIDARAQTNPVIDIQDRLNRLKSDSAITNDINKASCHPGSYPMDAATPNIPFDDTAVGKPVKPNLSEIERLMHEVASEMQIDADRAIEGLKKDKDLWNRVQRLKNSRGARENSGSHDAMEVESNEEHSFSGNEDDEDDEAATKRIIQQLMEESQLDEISGHGDLTRPVPPSVDSQSVKTASASSSEANTDELPWCCICNNDACLRCTGCDGDLYCLRCYREGHDKFEMKDHKTVRYTAPAAPKR